SATPEHEDKSPTDSVNRLNLRIIGAPQRFVISSDYFHHSGVNIAEAEVDSIVRSSASAIATVTTVTAAIDADATADSAPVAPSLFGVGSSSTGRTDSVPGGFSNVSGSDFLIGGIRTVVDPDSDLQKVYVPRWSETNGFGLDENRICREMLNEFSPPKFFASVRMRAEYNIREKRKLKAVVDEQAELLKRSERCLRERERERKNELSVKVTDLSALVKVMEQEVADLDAQATAVHELEISFAGLQEKVATYEDFIGQLKKFQDKKIEEVNEKFDKLCADFVDMGLHLKEKFYPHLLTTIFGRRWLLTYGMELDVIKCLNSIEYLSALGAAISKVVEKGMQEGLSAGITHGAEGRKLADVASYNPFVKANYLSALQRLQNVNFSLIAELKSNKDANLMVPIHHSPDQCIIGASALSLSLDVSHSWIKKMRENIAKHVSALRGVFVPLSEPLSFAALEGTEGTSGSTHDTTTILSTTFVSASTIPPISTDDDKVAHADGQGVPMWVTRP
nr:hypothetical protein [Tanacetum cinerariifolium]